MEFPFTYKNDERSKFFQFHGLAHSECRYGTEAFEDMFLLAECDYQIGTISSHFSVIPGLLRFAKGYASPPIYLDIEKASKQEYQA